jgi:hypothetical protein
MENIVKQLGDVIKNSDYSIGFIVVDGTILITLTPKDGEAIKLTLQNFTYFLNNSHLLDKPIEAEPCEHPLDKRYWSNNGTGKCLACGRRFLN